MKLLQINSVIDYGSTGRIMKEIGNVAAHLGWKSYYGYGRDFNTDSNDPSVIKIGNNTDLYFHFLLTRLWDKHGLGSKQSTLHFIREIEKIGPDIIHLHNIHGYYLNYPVLFDFLSVYDIPVVWTLHDCWPITGHCTYFSFIDCHKWERTCAYCPQKNEYPSSFIKDRSYANFHKKKACFSSVKNMTLVPVSNWLNQIISHSFLSKYPIQTIYNGIDTTIFTPTSTYKSNSQNQPFNILGVANLWDTRKGLNEFYKLRSVLNNDFTITLVGLSPKQIKQLPDGIKGINRTQNLRQLSDLYSMADVYLNLTFEDNFPTTNLEALSCGTPVITYKTGGSIEAIDEKTGKIVKQGDIKELKEAVFTIQRNGKNFYSMNCRERVKTHFEKYTQYGKYIQLYNNLLK